MAWVCSKLLLPPLLHRLACREVNRPLPAERDEARYLVFDGDVDAVWVENMNSVMDDNKLLTLPNGERIRLQSHVKLLFEVADLQYASPATISRWVCNLGCQYIAASAKSPKLSGHAAGWWCRCLVMLEATQHATCKIISIAHN